MLFLKKMKVKAKALLSVVYGIPRYQLSEPLERIGKRIAGADHGWWSIVVSREVRTWSSSFRDAKLGRLWTFLVQCRMYNFALVRTLHKWALIDHTKKIVNLEAFWLTRFVHGDVEAIVSHSFDPTLGSKAGKGAAKIFLDASNRKNWPQLGTGESQMSTTSDCRRSMQLPRVDSFPGNKRFNSLKKKLSLFPFAALSLPTDLLQRLYNSHIKRIYYLILSFPWFLVN